MKKIKDWLLKDLWLKVVSIFLAVVIWFVWIQIENPTIPKDFSNIKVTITNQEELDPDKKVWEVLDNTDNIKVTVKAPKTVINSLTASDIIAEADASKMVDNEIPISLRLAGDPSYDSLTPNHETVSLAIEDRERRYVRIMKKVYGETAENYKFGGVNMDLNMIEITGPKSAIESVAYGQVDINIDGVSESLSANIEIELYDAGNNLVNLPTITKQSDYVHVDVIILETKTVPIYASKMGEAAEGFLYAKNLEIKPAVVTVAGSAADLQGLSRINITDPIDISGATGDVTESVDISPYIPDNLIFADNDYDGMVDVTIFVEPREEKSISFKASDVSFINIPDGYDLTAEGGMITVYLTGLSSDLEDIDPEVVGKTVDVAEWMDNLGIKKLEEGIHLMPVSIGVSSSIKMENEPMVSVKVTEKTTEKNAEETADH